MFYNYILSETIELFDRKPSWNVPWMVLYKMSVFVFIGNLNSFNIRPYRKTKKKIRSYLID